MDKTELKIRKSLAQRPQSHAVDRHEQGSRLLLSLSRGFVGGQWTIPRCSLKVTCKTADLIFQSLKVCHELPELLVR